MIGEGKFPRGAGIAEAPEPAESNKTTEAPEAAAKREATEMSETINSFASFLDIQKKLKLEEIEDEQELKDAYRSVTEFQFLITHYIASQRDNEEGVRKIWQELRSIATEKGERDNFPIFKRGVVTQVATHRIFGELGFHPRFSHPDEDAFKKIDLWSDETHAVQVKGSADTEEVGVFPTDKVSPNSVKVLSKDGKRVKFFDGDFRSLKTSVRTFGKDTEGYFIVIPASKINSDTGKPTPELIEIVKQKLAQGIL